MEAAFEGNTVIGRVVPKSEDVEDIIQGLKEEAAEKDSRVGRYAMAVHITNPLHGHPFLIRKVLPSGTEGIFCNTGVLMLYSVFPQSKLIVLAPASDWELRKTKD